MNLAQVEVKDNDVEKAIKQLRKKVASDGALKTYREHTYYKSKGEKAREKAKVGRRKQLKEMRRQERIEKRYE